MKKQPRYGAYREDDSILRNTVEPRFTAVDPSSRYSDETGFGWLSDGEREAVSIPLTPYHEMRAVAKEPRNLPHDRLFRDSVRGSGAQEFALKADPGEYRVLLLHPDGAVDEQKLTAVNGRLTIPFAAGDVDGERHCRQGIETRGGISAGDRRGLGRSPGDAAHPARDGAG